MQTKSTKTLYLKLNGNTEEYDNHQVDAKQLANALSNFSDLIIASDERLNGDESDIKVKANAKFIEGSFGVEMIIEYIPMAINVFTVLGFGVAGAATKSLLSTIKELKGRKISADIEIDTTTGKAKIPLKDGTMVEAPKEVAELIESPSLRKTLDELVNGSVGINGTTSLTIANDEDFQEELFKVEADDSEYFRSNANSSRKPYDLLESTATIQFTRANRNSGTSGWKMTHLGEEVSVVINDEVFLNSIVSDQSPRIFAQKFKVKLLTKMRNGVGDTSKKYVILEVQK